MGKQAVEEGLSSKPEHLTTKNIMNYSLWHANSLCSFSKANHMCMTAAVNLQWLKASSCQSETLNHGSRPGYVY